MQKPWTNGHRSHPGINPMEADNLAEQILRGNVELPEVRLTLKSLQRVKSPGNHVLQRVEEALCGERRWRRACLQTVCEMEGFISTALLNILQKAGCDPAAWLLISPHVSSISLPGSMGGNTVMSPEPDEPKTDVIDTHVHLGKSAYWLGEGRLDIITNLPETVLQKSIGHPLKDLLSHQALDPIPMKVTGINDNGADGIIIDTDYRDLPDIYRRTTLMSLGKGLGENAGIPNRIAEFRKMAEMTQKALAAEIGVSRQTLNVIERGGTPSLSTAVRLGRILEKDVETLFPVHATTKML